jgi:hypothetical protein
MMRRSRSRRIFVVLPALRIGDVVAAPPTFAVGNSSAIVGRDAPTLPPSGLFQPSMARGRRCGDFFTTTASGLPAKCSPTFAAPELPMAACRILNARENDAGGTHADEWLHRQHQLSGYDGHLHRQQLAPPLFTIEDVASGRRMTGVAPWLVDWVRLS